ncbi:Uncharacterized protein cmbei_5003830 [Cryptosporidium meleagridis]
MDELKSKIEPNERHIEIHSNELEVNNETIDEIEQGKGHDINLESDYEHQNQEERDQAEDKYKSKIDTETKQKERETDNELYAQNDCIYGDEDVKLYNNDNNNQPDRKINDIYTNNMENNSDNQLETSDYEQEPNDFNDSNNIDDHNSTLFSEEIPISQE